MVDERSDQPNAEPSQRAKLESRIIYRCIVGSRAYGLDHEKSDVDRRGFFLPPADLQWSLAGVPEQLENKVDDEVYFEIAKFIRLALKGNPTILECLYTPIRETVSPLAQELLDAREMFLSRNAYQTYHGFATSQLRLIQRGLDKRPIKWKQAMHLIRLQYAGIHLLRKGSVSVHAGEHCDLLLAIRDGRWTWSEVESLHNKLTKEMDLAFSETSLPEQPDFDRANEFLIRARRSALEDTLP